MATESVLRRSLFWLGNANPRAVRCEDEIQSSLSTILASVDSRRVVYQLAHDDEQQNVVEKWMHLFRTLIDERGPWSTNPFPDSVVRHWKFDKTEGAWRRRLKLRHSYHFDEKLCHPPSTSPSKEATVPINESKSGLGEHIPEQMKQFLLKMVHRITDEPTLMTTENNADLSGQKAFVSVDLLESQHPELVKDNSDQFKTGDSSSSPPET